MNGAADSGVLVLAGSAFERGLAQARCEPDSIEPVRRAVALRRELAHERLVAARRYLDAQWDFHAQHAAGELDEMRGVARGYGIDERELFAYLHLGVVGDFSDGCTAWARSDGTRRALVGKNRDFRGEHLGLQRLFRHSDPAWGGRRVLAVGSLGSPGVYSSGVNSTGLALADTHVGTRDHGVGLNRYFLMTRILAQASTVDEALDLVRGTVHAGGGSLVLADRFGAVAAVELGHRASAIERHDAGFVVRTNHFIGAQTAPSWLVAGDDPLAANSPQRRVVAEKTIRAWPASVPVETAFGLMSRHDGVGGVGLCRHGLSGDARTLSCAIFALDPPTLYFSAGTPCTTAPVEAVP